MRRSEIADIRKTQLTVHTRASENDFLRSRAGTRVGRMTSAKTRAQARGQAGGSGECIQDHEYESV